MASLPARQQAQRPSPHGEIPGQAHAPVSPVRTRSATSEDSQTLFLNSAHDEEQQSRQQSQNQQSSAPPPPRYQNNDDDPSIKKCWICFSDATEDTPETSPWRDPCPCALVAHEECLLDWIADMESPKNSRNKPIGGPKIECPQCKSEIKLARPRDYVVDAVRGVERISAQWVIAGAGMVISGLLYNSSVMWGVHSIYAIFGEDDGFRILRPFFLNAIRPPVEAYNGNLQEAARKAVTVALDRLVHWRLYVGLPLISPILILSRTKLADAVLPVLPIIFFATQHHSLDPGLDFTHWPPSASLSFALLPYVRSAYNHYYERVWAAREKQWLKQIQPRHGQGQNDANIPDGVADLARPDQAAAAADNDDDNIFEVRIDGGLWEDWDEDPGQPQPDAQANRAAPPPMPQQQLGEEDQAAQPPPNIADGRQPPAANPAQNNQQADRRLSFSPTTIAETVLGALLFPALAGLSGDLLKLLLPIAWTTSTVAAPSSILARLRPGSRVPAKGLLQEKWARSLVGGCLLVVAKDAVVLYVRWKVAQMHRGRSVLDYKRKNGERRRL